MEFSHLFGGGNVFEKTEDFVGPGIVLLHRDRLRPVVEAVGIDELEQTLGGLPFVGRGML